MHRIGIDLGGTKTEVILLDENSQILEKKRVTTTQDYDRIINDIVSLTDSIVSGLSEYKIGICTPGAISKKTGLLKNSNTQCLIGRPLKQDLEKRLRKKISMENDANCFAIAEATLGAAKDFDVVFGVIMGTGVGGGVVIDKKLHRGRTNIAGEWGHHTLHPNGNSCYCGKKGCAETYLSGKALEKLWKGISGHDETVPQILQHKESEIQKWKNVFLENFGLGLANVIDILDPDVIVLGGGLSNIDFLYNEGKDSVYEKVFSDLVETPILKNQLGDSAGVFGAAFLD